MALQMPGEVTLIGESHLGRDVRGAYAIRKHRSR
jgi:hypothetical protein